MLSPVAGISCV